MLINYLINTISNPYLFEDYEAPNLDLSLPWYDDIDESIGICQEYQDQETDYLNAYTLQAGDIVSADVYQDKADFINLKHLSRPFLIISVSHNRVYGLQLSHDPAKSLVDGAVPIEDFTKNGLRRFGYIITNMERGVEYKYLNYKIGHITPETKDRLLSKLREIKANKNNAYSEYPILNRIDSVIEKAYRIIV